MFGKNKNKNKNVSNKTKLKSNKTKKPFNKDAWIIGILGVCVIAVFSYIFITSNQKATAVVPSGNIAAGSVVAPDQVKSIKVPAKTPKGYLTDPQSVIGQKLSTDARQDQLLYPTNIQSNFNEFGDNMDIPKNYILTSLQVPNERAVGGLVTAGSYVDISGIPSSGFAGTSRSTMSRYLGGIADDSFGTSSGINGYWVLNNVKVLQSTTSDKQKAAASASKNSKNGNNSTSSSSQSNLQDGTYIIALSYSDYKKLLIAEQYLTLYINVGPKTGYKESEITKGNNLRSITDSQADAKTSKHQSDQTTDNK